MKSSDLLIRNIPYVSGIDSSTRHIATNGQTDFSCIYHVGYIHVYLNGSKLDVTDFTAVNGTSVILIEGATTGDIVDIVAFGAFELADHYNKTEADALLAAKLNSSAYTASDVLTKLLTVDGSGSGLDADTLDTLNSSQFLRSDIDDVGAGTTTLAKVEAGSGPIHEGSSAVLQAKGFMRTGTIYLHEGQAPVEGTDKQLSNVDGVLKWDGSTIGGGGLPAGSVFFFATSSAPAGTLKCNGAAVSRTTYSSLFAEISTQWGVGDGSTTFNLPDLRGEFIRGWDDGRGADSGRVFGSYQSASSLGHTHSGTTSTKSADQKVPSSTGFTNARVSSHSHTYTTSSNGAISDVHPRNRALLACIAY